jgi:hypothetical protein
MSLPTVDDWPNWLPDPNTGVTPRWIPFISGQGGVIIPKAKDECYCKQAAGCACNETHNLIDRQDTGLVETMQYQLTPIESLVEFAKQNPLLVLGGAAAIVFLMKKGK